MFKEVHKGLLTLVTELADEESEFTFTIFFKILNYN